MEGKFGGEWICACVWLHSFTAQIKLSQYCWFAIAQYNTKSSKKEKKNFVCEEAAEGRDMGRDHGGSHTTRRNFHFLFREPMWGSEVEADLAASLPLTLWESEALCRFHSTLGQTRNHSPECKPPILQDVGNLEQETTVTHTLTSLSLTPCSPVWGQKGSRAWRWPF